MKNSPNPSHVYLRYLGGCAAAAILCACAATSVKKTWKSPEFAGPPVTKIAVITVDERGFLRRGFENRFVEQLKQQGVSAIPTYELLSLAEINRDKPAAAERFRAAGAQAVIVMRLVDMTTRYRETRPGGERYAETITGFETGGWYNYYSVAFTDFSPTYGNLKQHIYLETRLFDLATAKGLWSGLTETTITESMDRVAEMDPIVAKVLAAMRKDGVIP
jgi:hypothetical protein